MKIRPAFSSTTGKRLFTTAAVSAAIVILLSTAALAFNTKIEMVPMRDGVKLATDVWLPGENKGKLPAILMRTPYGKSMGALFATTVLSKGFVWVVQDTRGRFDSEGASRSFLDDTLDGYDTIEWISKQPWSDGTVGTTGISAMGITQYVMAADPNPALKTQYVMAAAGSLYHDGSFIGGGFRRSLVLKWVGGNKFPIEFLETLLQNPNYNELWKSTNLHEHLDKINYPILHMAGWYDIFLMGNMKAFMDIQANGAEGARGRQHLIIGPWTHGGWAGLTSTKQGQLMYPQNSKYNMMKKMMPWFQETMLGQNKGFLDGPAIEYYVMGDPSEHDAPGNQWRTTDSWPPPSTPTPFYFHADKTLSTDKPAGADKTAFIADPDNPVPTIGGANLVLKAGPMDQREIETRGDVLTFTTDALTEPLEVTGLLKAVLFVSTDVPDMDLTVRFCDVYPDGRSMLVADGLLRASHRDGSDHFAPHLESGKVYQLDVDVTATSIIFNKGHRIRVSVAGSNFPRFDINLNNGKFFDLEPGELRRAVEEGLGKYVDTPDTGPDARIAHDTLYLGGDQASYMLLPVVK